MAEKHIFIGLGGAGVNTVSRLKYKIYEKLVATRYASRLDQLQADYRFLFVDTDNNDVLTANKQYGDRFENGRELFINPVSELLDLGPQNPRAIHTGAKRTPHYLTSKRLLEACEDEVAARIPNQTLRDGAGAFRMSSRIAFAHMAGEFISRLHSFISELSSIEKGAVEKNTIYYWVVSSSCGGTGSGIINDVLYYVNMLHKKMISSEDPSVVLMLYMPQFYIDNNYSNPRYPKNGLSTLLELETFQRVARDENLNTLFHRLAIQKDYNQFDTELSYRPFKYCVPIDFQTDNESNMGSIQNMYNNTAEMLYYLHSGPGALGFRAHMSNYVDEVQYTDPRAFLVPMGYIALRKPEKDLEDYLQARMRYELMKYGIFGKGIADPAEKRRLAEELFRSVIFKHVLSSGEGKNESLLARYTAVVEARIDEELSDNYIKDSDGKYLNKLPANISHETAESVISDCRKKIKDMSRTLNEEVLNRTEEELWDWTERNIIEHGLEYVQEVLFELDGYCVEYYNTYVVGNRGASIQQSKQRHADELQGNLDDLHQKAIEVTLSERFGRGNRDDVNRYFQNLKEYARARLELLVNDEVYEVIRQLCFEEEGRIDKIEHYVVNLKAEGYTMLIAENGIEEAYDKLAKAFVAKSQDVTSVYLPEIQEFADGYGWKDDHLFSRLYGQIIKPGNEYVRGQGYVPVRFGDSRSLEAFFIQMKRDNEEMLLQNGYVSGEKVRLFINHTLENKRKLLEDVLDAASVTMERLSKMNDEITGFNAKTLPQLFNELDREKRREIQGRLNPSIFFSYCNAMDNQFLRELKIYVAPSKDVAEGVLQFSSDRDSTLAVTPDPSSLYLIRSKVGMTLNFYRTYDVIKQEYDKTNDKEFYHFHAAFAKANGDPARISLKRELAPELITFAQYLLMNGYREVLKSYYYASDNAFDRDNYADTPFIMESARALIATYKNTSLKNGNVCLTCKNTSGQDEFISLVFGGAVAPYLAMYQKFRSLFVEEKLEASIEGVISMFSRIAATEMMSNYNAVRQEVIGGLDKSWQESDNREEKAFLADLLLALTSELDTYDKFIL